MRGFFNLVVTVIAIFISASVFAQDAKLIEATKKEGGKVVLYGSLEPDTTEAIIKGFEKRTGLKVEYWRASATQSRRPSPQ